MTTPLLGPASGTTTPHGAPSGPTHAGGPRVLAHGRDSGLPDVDALAAETLAAYAASDACCPDGFPELPRAEASLVGFGLDLVDAPGDAVGTVTGAHRPPVDLCRRRGHQHLDGAARARPRAPRRCAAAAP